MSDELRVSPAGGDVFTISATSNGNTVTAKSKVVTKRLMYIVEGHMNGLTTITPNLNLLSEEFEKHHIEFKMLTPFEIDWFGNIAKKDEDAFKNHVADRYGLSAGVAKEPYSIAIAYTGQLADMGSGELDGTYDGSMGDTIIIDVRDKSKNIQYLWTDLDDTDWFVECYYQESGALASPKVPIQRDKCRAIQSRGSYKKGWYDQVEIDVSDLPKDKKWDVVLTVNWVNSFRGGVSFSTANIAAVCTSVYWIDRNNPQQQDAAIHEVGHQLGMVPPRR